MTKTLIITDYSIKHQAFNGHKPKLSDPIIKSIINKIRSGNMERLMIGGKELYKLYVLGTKYRAIIRVEQNVIYLLILVETSQQFIQAHLIHFIRHISILQIIKLLTALMLMQQILY